MHINTDFDGFRAALAAAVATGDDDTVRAAILPEVRAMSSEHGTRFRELIGALPVEIWHNDPEITAHLGGSFRGNDGPRGHAPLGYFRAAEGALAITPEAPPHCHASVLLGHAAALRTMGLLDQARVKAQSAHEIISTQLADVPNIRIELGARYSLENGMLELEQGDFDSARAHLEYAHGLAGMHLTRAEHVELLGAIAKIDVSSGHFERAEEEIRHAKDLAEGTELMQTGFGAPALVAEVWLANERFDLASSVALVPAMLDAACRNEWEPHAYVIAAQSAALQGQLIESLDLVERALQGYASWERAGFGADFARLLRAALLLGLDHADESWAILQTLHPGENHVLCPARITAQLRMVHGDLLGAAAAIHDCEALGELHCARTVVDIQLIRAAIELARGNRSASDVSADRAFMTMARTGSRPGLQRISPATLGALAHRAIGRQQKPQIVEMLTRIAELTKGHDQHVEPLSVRERLVLAQVQRGLTVAAIASELYISPNTVKTHLRRLYRKLDVSTREEAIRAARSLGLDREITRNSPDETTARVLASVI